MKAALLARRERKILTAEAPALENCWSARWSRRRRGSLWPHLWRSLPESNYETNLNWRYMKQSAQFIYKLKIASKIAINQQWKHSTSRQRSWCRRVNANSNALKYQYWENICGKRYELFAGIYGPPSSVVKMRFAANFGQPWGKLAVQQLN